MTLKMKTFMWSIFMAHFTLAAFLCKPGFTQVKYPHCTSYVENMRYTFWTSMLTELVEYFLFCSPFGM
ncbi:hypothetical protein KP509_13G003100 [Ceratopteris richardii]|uniref:Uncharacterized protein n=1 Tax=Ceratopteris richardii TaxID=49495 RepID=A0A8T2TEU8_CERRI|nr:hypothetical protein KP509_13G003100 [Ceratopteris richardii]